MGNLCGGPQDRQVRPSFKKDGEPVYMCVQHRQPAASRASACLLSKSAPRPGMRPGERAEFPESVCPGRVRSCLIGDGGVGKTALLHRHMKDDFNKEYLPTVFDDYQ